MADPTVQIDDPVQSLDDLPDSLTQLLTDAQGVNATDIHIDAVGEEYDIRFRVDGALQTHDTLNQEDGGYLVNQIKVAARFTPDRAVLPLEGRLQWSDGADEYGARITIMPTAGDEAYHLRLLKPPSEILDPEQLGFSEDDLEVIRTTFRHPEGLILISGPTGAGKTMSLYSLASLLDASSLVTCSIEDPVEYQLDRVRQAQVDEDNGLTMHEGLTALLRMDPDIIIIGEIRDRQSAVTAVRAAASGRFVLATVHAREAPVAVQMLGEYSVPPHLIAGTLRLIVSQELVRKLCPDCAKARPLEDHEKALFEQVHIECPDEVKSAEGCDACHGYGYQGRIGIFQTIHVTDAMRRAILAGTDARGLREVLQNEGVDSLLHNALEKVAEGVTSLEEATTLHGVDADLNQ